MSFNWIAVGISTIMPLLVGFIYYNPKVLGTAWMNACGFTEEQMKTGANMPMIFGLCALLGFMITIAIHPMVIHQWGFFSSLMTAENGDIFAAASPANTMVTDYVAKYGDNFRSYKHGAFHGLITSIFFALPLIAINALFERRGSKYIFIHFGYWALTLAGMCAVICGMK
jgi:Protein of unknown function (DUF1761)